MKDQLPEAIHAMAGRCGITLPHSSWRKDDDYAWTNDVHGITLWADWVEKDGLVILTTIHVKFDEVDKKETTKEFIHSE